MIKEISVAVATAVILSAGAVYLDLFKKEINPTLVANEIMKDKVALTKIAEIIGNSVSYSISSPSMKSVDSTDDTLKEVLGNYDFCALKQVRTFKVGGWCKVNKESGSWVLMANAANCESTCISLNKS